MPGTRCRQQWIWRVAPALDVCVRFFLVVCARFRFVAFFSSGHTSGVCFLCWKSFFCRCGAPCIHQLVVVFVFLFFFVVVNLHYFAGCLAAVVCAAIGCHRCFVGWK